ncbi:hypothetical protein RRG08_011447 [Elysia crispata]|uniref:Uncharacterized protein n=1 Tax=Elysia crispata TaxID=231223 RepID=A0AAE0ZUH2_9GAST|nr:hypothetical protein RRG08_011447 [Elysia crispata]
MFISILPTIPSVSYRDVSNTSIRDAVPHISCLSASSPPSHLFPTGIILPTIPSVSYRDVSNTSIRDAVPHISCLPASSPPSHLFPTGMSVTLVFVMQYPTSHVYQHPPHHPICFLQGCQ